MIIYCIENLINHKKYIGYSTFYNSEENFQKSNYWGSSCNKEFWRSLKKHGKENFKRWLILKNIFDFKELCRYEKLWIIKLKTKAPFGYNLADGGSGSKGCKWNKESKKRGSIASSKRYAIMTIKERKEKYGKNKGIHYKCKNIGTFKGKARLGKKYPGQYKNRIYKRICKECDKEFVSKSGRKLLCDKCEQEQLKYHITNKYKNRIYSKKCSKCGIIFKSNGANTHFCNNCK